MTQKILLVDGCPVFRLGMREVIKSAFSDPTYLEATTFAESYAVLQSDRDITFVLMELDLADCDGFVGLFQIRNEFPETPVLLVFGKPDEALMHRAIQLGAAGCTSKCAPVIEFVRMLEAISQGIEWVSAPNPVCDDGDEFAVAAIASLSPSQIRILLGLQKGLRNKQIAFEMGVTENTVKAYTTTLFLKLGVSSRTQALLLARKALATRNFP